MWYPCNYRGGGGISNSQIVTEEGKYALDAVQNNPDVDNTLASKIKKLETTSPIAIKDITTNNVEIRTAYISVYYGLVSNFFTDNNIPGDNVISIILQTWGGGEAIFTLYMYRDADLGFISPVPQTIASVTVRVVYLK